jgi:hypothetical protein
MATEEDIELTEEEISVTRLSLLVFIGLLNDVLLEEDSIESFEEWEETCKEQVGLDSDSDLTGLLHSALKKFREEKEYGDGNQEASQD